VFSFRRFADIQWQTSEMHPSSCWTTDTTPLGEQCT